MVSPRFRLWFSMVFVPGSLPRRLEEKKAFILPFKAFSVSLWYRLSLNIKKARNGASWGFYGHIGILTIKKGGSAMVPPVPGVFLIFKGNIARVCFPAFAARPGFRLVSIFHLFKGAMFPVKDKVRPAFRFRESAF